MKADNRMWDLLWSGKTDDIENAVAGERFFREYDRLEALRSEHEEVALTREVQSAPTITERKKYGQRGLALVAILFLFVPVTGFKRASTAAESGGDSVIRAKASSKAVGTPQVAREEPGRSNEDAHVAQAATRQAAPAAAKKRANADIPLESKPVTYNLKAYASQVGHACASPSADRLEATVRFSLTAPGVIHVISVNGSDGAFVGCVRASFHRLEGTVSREGRGPTNEILVVINH